MDIVELKALVKQGESTTLEFKSSTAKLKSIFETLCAFLNTEGGVVLIGVKDDGRLVGQSVTDHTQLEIANLIAKLEPPTPVSVEYIPFDAKQIIKLSVSPNSELLPYAFDGKAFWRIGSSTHAMPQQQYQQLLIDRARFARVWDSDIAHYLSVDDLDEQAILQTLDESIERGRTKAALASKNAQSALQTLGLLKNGLITNAAGILFCKDPENNFPHSLLRLAAFRGLTKSTLIDSKRIYGHAFSLIEEAETFLMRHMSIASEFVGGQMARVDHPDYALRAVREAVVNAICHRDYSIQGGSISLMTYSDRLEITSHGTLPRGITVRDLKQTHESFPRNPKIAHVMYKCGLIESVGTGTQEMIEESKAIGAPQPEYIERGTTFAVQFFKRVSVQQQSLLNDRQKEILSIMGQLGQCSSTQILQAMAQPPTDRTLRNDLTELEKLERIKRQGGGRGTLWQLF